MNTAKADKRTWAERYKIKVVELLRMTTKEEREHAIRDSRVQHFFYPEQGCLH